MLKYWILFISLILTFPTSANSSKNDVDLKTLPKSKTQDTEILLQEIREISVKYSSSRSKLLKYKEEMERLEYSNTDVDELFYLREVVYAISVTTVAAAYQRLMLYQYPDLESENNIHTTTLIMSLRSTREQLGDFYSKLRMAKDRHIKSKTCNDIIEKCLSELYLIGDLTKRSMEILNSISSK